MRQLLPRFVPDAAASTVYGDILQRAAATRADRPYLALNMVASADGAISLDGVSGGLSGKADKDVFFYLRSLADVILVGAATARAENYGQPKLPPQLVSERAARGQRPLPRIAVVTRSMRLDWSARFFEVPSAKPAAERPYVICPAAAPPEQLAAAGQVSDVITAGNTEVDLPAALSSLAAAGARVVLCEGGPTLNGHLLSQGLVDELCLTLSPALVGGLGRRISGWDEAHEALPLLLLTVAEADGVLLLRYGISRVDGPQSAHSTTA